MRELNDVITDVVEELGRGGTLLYPTDTIWGLGCDACNAEAVERIYAIKERDRSKSMLVLCASMEMVEDYVGRVGEVAQSLLLDARRPTTVIMPLLHKKLAANLVAADGTIGIRIPRMEFCQQMLLSFGKPVVSTSANRSGQPSPSCFADIDGSLHASVDCCVPPDFEVRTGARSSRIVKILPDGSVATLRE